MLARRGQNLGIVRQRFGDCIRRTALKEHSINPFNDFRLFRIDDQIAICPHVVTQEPLERHCHFAVGETLTLAPDHVFANRPRFLLGKARHDSDESSPLESKVQMFSFSK